MLHLVKSNKLKSRLYFVIRKNLFHTHLSIMEVLSINRYIVIIFFILASLLAGCMKEKTIEPNEKSNYEIFEENGDIKVGLQIRNARTINFNVEEQEFSIVPIFEPYLEYIQKVEDQSINSYRELFHQIVVEPFRKTAFGENGQWVKDHNSFKAPINIERLEESIQILDQDFDYFIQLIKEVMKEAANLLPGGKTTIYLFPFNPDQNIAINIMNGVTAFATSNHQIVLHIAPQKYDEEMLKYALAHEYYHVVYYEKYKNRKRDLVEYVLSEGKADSFANILIPKFNAPWTKELSPEGVNTIWSWIKERRYSFNETDLGEMRNGNREIPPCKNF